MKHSSIIIVFIISFIGVLSCKEDSGNESKKKIEFTLFLEPAQFFDDKFKENKLHLTGWLQKAESKPIVIVNESLVIIVTDSLGKYWIADSTIIDNWPISKYYIQVGENNFEGYIEIPSKPYMVAINGINILESKIPRSNSYELTWECKRGNSFYVVDFGDSPKLIRLSEKKYYLNPVYLNENNSTEFYIFSVIGPMNPLNLDENTLFNVSNEFYKGSVTSINAEDFSFSLK